MPTTFFDLPLEIRRDVYAELLTCPDPLENEIFQWYRRFEVTGEDMPEKDMAMDLCPAILRVCRKTHEEAAEYLYTHNVFIMGHLEILAPFFAQIGMRNSSLLRHVIVYFPGQMSSAGKWVMDSPSPLDLIRTHCPNIACLEMAADDFFEKSRAGRDKEFLLAVEQIKAELDNMPSLRDTRMRMSPNPKRPHDKHLMRKMKGFGWVVVDATSTFSDFMKEVMEECGGMRIDKHGNHYFLDGKALTRREICELGKSQEEEENDAGLE